ncbi:phospho-glucose isomerase C-terminal SIS domain-containing protein [Nocardioides terrae]|uniref:Phospho-glucose isomerase C-terminal SIS domain-containing protein n=1 Tax=Nocardioides terrae TaxID=574651 RepID=A0A1I1DK65_9ACTN|nr:SIS domain-containing protein [Nocardioides terrae]SFB75359.1 phospho-glucose isomerase C-terminal SIS domain-containing protein [Nocardioides terrae]
MATWFDESRLEDELALAGADLRLRWLAESGARVRREAAESSEALGLAVERAASGRPRAVVAAGPDSRLVRAVLEPSCPVPFVAWPSPNLPGWVGSLDLVVVLAPDGGDPATASAVAEAVRRGSQVVVAGPERSLVAEHAAGRDATVLPVMTGDQLAVAVLVLSFLDRVGLGPSAEPEEVAAALDAVAIACSPHRDISVNPGKVLALTLADSLPLVWGGSVLAARAGRRVAESIRRASGRGALAGDAEHLLPVIEAARQHTVFDDPFDGGDGAGPRPVLVVLDDGADDPVRHEQRSTLTRAADERGVRVEVIAAEASSEVARYAELLLSGTYAAEYLRIGLVED